MSDSVKAIDRTKDIKYIKYYSPDSIPMNYMSSAIGDDAKIVEDVFEEKSNKEDANTMKYLKKTFTKPERYNMMVTIKQHDSGSKSIMEIRENDGLGRVAQIPYMNPSDGDVNFFEVEERKYIIVVYGENRDNILVMETNTMRYSVNHFMNAKDISIDSIFDYSGDPVTVYLNMKLVYGEIGDTVYTCRFTAYRVEDVLHMFKSGNYTIKSRHWTFADTYLYIYTTVHYPSDNQYTTKRPALASNSTKTRNSVGKDPKYFGINIEYIPKEDTNTFTDKFEIKKGINETFYIDAYCNDAKEAKAFINVDGYVYVLVSGNCSFTVINVDKEYAIHYVVDGDLHIDDILKEGKKIYAKCSIVANNNISSFKICTNHIDNLRDDDIVELSGESEPIVKFKNREYIPIFYYLCRFEKSDKKTKTAKVSLKKSVNRIENDTPIKDNEKVVDIRKLRDDILSISDQIIRGYEPFSKLNTLDQISISSHLREIINILNKELKEKE